MSDSWKCRALPSTSWWRKLRIRDNSSGFFSSIDLRYNDATFNSSANNHLSDISGTHCAPASKALLIKSAWVILRRISGDIPKAAIAAVDLCIGSSLIWPCSQSMMIPFTVVSVDYTTIDGNADINAGLEPQFGLIEKKEDQERSW
jgi:hypothetical protein